MTVTETIRVKSSGAQIRHGIYRDFPTRYRDRFGNNYVVDFRVTRVLRDGAPEGYHLKDLRNGRRVYMGKADVLVPPGDYAYILEYTTTRQLGFFKDFDELYWNVTGNGWPFPIDEASATVELPQGASGRILARDGYTGPFGAKGKDFSVDADKSGRVNFRTTKPLGPGEGLTIVVSWPKGYVREPTTAARLGYIFSDNRGALVCLVGLVALLMYYMAVWARFGKDPSRGVIIPLYTPPEKLSPAAMRYVMKMGFDHKAFTAALIDMAVKRYLTIREEGGVYTLVRTEEEKMALSQEESKIAGSLLGSDVEMVLENKNHHRIQSAISGLERSMRRTYEKLYFLTNHQYFIPGLVFTVIMVIVSSVSESLENLPIIIFMSV
jgi:hypothetical protein